MDCSKYTWLFVSVHGHVQTTSLWNIIMVVSQVILSGIMYGLRVDQLATGFPALADSLMMMQLCRHYLEVKTLQQCA